MNGGIAVLLGAVSILAVAASSQAAMATQVGFDPAAVRQVQSYHHYYHRRRHHAPVVVINPG